MVSTAGKSPYDPAISRRRSSGTLCGTQINPAHGGAEYPAFFYVVGHVWVDSGKETGAALVSYGGLPGSGSAGWDAGDNADEAWIFIGRTGIPAPYYAGTPMQTEKRSSSGSCGIGDPSGAAALAAGVPADPWERCVCAGVFYAAGRMRERRWAVFDALS